MSGWPEGETRREPDGVGTPPDRHDPGHLREPGPRERGDRDGPLRALVTNDDGLHAPGLLALATALDAAGHEVLAVAPHGDRSGSGAAIGNLVDGSYVRYREMPLAGLDRVHSIELDGPPALCVFAACLGAFGDPPELVASGLNPGLNTGRLTLHSGTVGAALTAANLGLSAVATSIAGREHSIEHWDTGGQLTVQVPAPGSVVEW